MELKTRHFGVIEIDEKGILDFPEGLPGFENLKKFVLLGNAEEDSPFQWLQGVDDPSTAFVVIQPKIFMPDYEVEIPDQEVEELHIEDTTKVLVYAIVVVPEDIKKMTANLKAPILINMENNKGKQVIMEKGEYQVKHYILEGLQKIGGQK